MEKDYFTKLEKYEKKSHIFSKIFRGFSRLTRNSNFRSLEVQEMFERPLKFCKHFFLQMSIPANAKNSWIQFFPFFIIFVKKKTPFPFSIEPKIQKNSNKNFQKIFFQE